MVILGLGSNVGDRLAHLRHTLISIKKIPGLSIKKISPVYLSDALLPDQAPTDWDKPYLNAAIACETSLEPLELLATLKKIEYALGRQPDIKHWGPRIIDIDILAWDELIISNEALTVPHEKLQHRPFALWPLADIAPFWTFPLPGPHHGKCAAEMVLPWGSRFEGNAPLHTRQVYQRIDTPKLVSIINVTPDSFSDGGMHHHPDAIMAYALQAVQDGAEILDIGAQSTAPSAIQLSPEQEWSRLAPVLSIIQSRKKEFLIPPLLSIDTYHPEVAMKAIDQGIDWINDVTGFKNPAMQALLTDSKKEGVMMHHLSIPADPRKVLSHRTDTINVMIEWAESSLAALEKQGIKRDHIIMDPGIGFGKTAEQSWFILKNIAQFKQLGVRILVGYSRKSFLSTITPFPPNERDIETLAISLAIQSVDYLRVHDVQLLARGFRTKAAMV